MQTREQFNWAWSYFGRAWMYVKSFWCCPHYETSASYLAARKWHDGFHPGQIQHHLGLLAHARDQLKFAERVFELHDKRLEWLFTISGGAASSLFVLVNALKLTNGRAVISFALFVLAMVIAMRGRSPQKRPSEMSTATVAEHWQREAVPEIWLAAALHVVTTGLNSVNAWKAGQATRASIVLVVGLISMLLLWI